MAYTITNTLTNLTASGDTTITSTATVTLSAATGYRVPANITVSGADYTYDDYTDVTKGVITLSNPTGNVTITAVGLTEEERFNADMDGIVDVINAKAGTTGDKYLPQVKHTAGTITTAKTEQTKTVALSMASGDQTITPDTGKVLTQVTVEKPATLAAGNIKDGTTIGGVTGTFSHVASNGATAGDILSGKKAYVNGAEVTGNIASKSAQTYTPTTSDQTIAAGQYLSGAQTVKGDANLVAGNIKKDVTIFGTTGSYEGGGGGGASIGGAGFTFASSVQTGGSIAGFILGQVDNGGSYGWHSFDWENSEHLIDGVENDSDIINASLVVFTSVSFRCFDGGEVKLYDGTTVNTDAGFSAAVGKLCYLTQDTYIAWSD